MRRINVAYSKSYTTTTTSVDQLREVISEGIYEQIILPIFGENNDQISNMKYIETKLIDNYICFDFDLNNTLMFRIAVSASALNGTNEYDVSYDFIASNSADASTYINRTTGGKLSCKYTTDTTSIYWTLSFEFNCMVLNSELKAIWAINHMMNVVFDTVTIDSEDIPVACSLGSQSKIYRLSSTSASVIDNATRTFDLENKVMVEKIPISENSKIIGLLNDVIKIHNTTLGSTVFALTSCKQLIEVDGVRYRQIIGPYWIVDQD